MEINNKNAHDEKSYQRARKKVKEIKSFYYNLSAYCTVIPILIFINLKYSPEFLWFFFSMVGWGLGLSFHGMQAFGYMPFLGKDWEAKKFKELMEQEQQKKINTNGRFKQH
jgi:hypothetical protein